MLDSTDRRHVESLKSARTIRVIINENGDDELTLIPRSGYPIGKLTHDIALAFQDYFNRAKKND